MLFLAFLPSIGGWEWVLIFLVILLVFGAASIPKIARSLGRSSGEFKKGLREGAKGEEEGDETEEKEEEETPPED